VQLGKGGVAVSSMVPAAVLEAGACTPVAEAPAGVRPADAVAGAGTFRLACYGFMQRSPSTGRKPAEWQMVLVVCLPGRMQQAPEP
jgi:hypothetical protein